MKVFTLTLFALGFVLVGCSLGGGYKMQTSGIDADPPLRTDEEGIGEKEEDKTKSPVLGDRFETLSMSYRSKTASHLTVGE